jgi:hypothetical protein
MGQETFHLLELSYFFLSAFIFLYVEILIIPTIISTLLIIWYLFIPKIAFPCVHVPIIVSYKPPIDRFFIQKIMVITQPYSNQKHLIAQWILNLEQNTRLRLLNIYLLVTKIKIL